MVETSYFWAVVDSRRIPIPSNALHNLEPSCPFPSHSRRRYTLNNSFESLAHVISDYAIIRAVGWLMTATVETVSLPAFVTSSEFAS